MGSDSVSGLGEVIVPRNCREKQETAKGRGRSQEGEEEGEEEREEKEEN